MCSYAESVGLHRDSKVGCKILHRNTEITVLYFACVCLVKLMILKSIVMALYTSYPLFAHAREELEEFLCLEKLSTLLLKMVSSSLLSFTHT